jgi:hypothetical protein
MNLNESKFIHSLEKVLAERKVIKTKNEIYHVIMDLYQLYVNNDTQLFNDENINALCSIYEEINVDNYHIYRKNFKNLYDLLYQEIVNDIKENIEYILSNNDIELQYRNDLLSINDNINTSDVMIHYENLRNTLVIISKPKIDKTNFYIPFFIFNILILIFVFIL